LIFNFNYLKSIESNLYKKIQRFFERIVVSIFIVNLIRYSQLKSSLKKADTVEFWNLSVLLLLLILALYNIKQRRILGNLGQSVGNRTTKSTRQKVLPPGLLRLVTINCRYIPEDNNEVEKLLEKKTMRTFPRFSLLKT